MTRGRNSLLGPGRVVWNPWGIGSEAIIGYATAVTKKVGDGQSVIGNPMRVLRKPLTLIERRD